MALTNSECRGYRFGPFELDVHTGELRKHGVRLNLQTQPFQVLSLLLDRAGELVTRVELGERLWPGDTFVDFDNGLNIAIRKLRQALNDSAETPRYIETLSRRGYRFVAPVQKIIQQPSRSEEPPAEHLAAVPVPHPPESSAFQDPPHLEPGVTVRPTRRWLALAAALLVPVLAGGAYWSYRHSHPTGGYLTMGVLPFADLSGDATLGVLADSLSEQLTHVLSNQPGLLMASPTGAMQFKGKLPDLAEAGRRLQAATILEGSVQRRDRRIHIVAQLVRVADGYHIWSENYEFPVEDIAQIQDNVAGLIARTVHARFAGVTDPGDPRGRHHPLAVQYYAKAREEWLTLRVSGVREACTLYQQAFSKDPEFADAYAGLGQALLYLAGFEPGPSEARVEQARQALVKALQLDDRLPEAHAALGNLLLFHHWNFRAAERELKRAVQLQPGPEAYTRWYALAATYRGHHQEAEEELRYANLVKPGRDAILAELGRVAMETGRLPEAEQLAQQAASISPRYPPARFLLGLIREERKDYREALKQFDACSAYKEWGFDCAAAGARVQILAGNPTAARDLDARIIKPTSKALLALTRGDRQAALAALEFAAESKDQDLLRVRFDPRFDSLRAEPRFIALWKKLEM